MEGRSEPGGSDRAPTDALDLRVASGTWLVLSASQTVYRLDLDRRLLRREPGPSSARGPFDGEWVPLVQVEVLLDDLSTAQTSTIAVGRRHLYLTDPRGGVEHYRWWLQQMAEQILQVDGRDVAVDHEQPNPDPGPGPEGGNGSGDSNGPGARSE